jgi:DNA-binding transcriptional LysR family regulator
MATPLSPACSRRYLRHGMLPHLVVLDAVVRLGGVTRASEALCMAQPTVSGHLRKLGEALGVRLFTVRGKRLEPTDAARSVLAAAQDVFATLERCEQDLAALRTAPAPEESGPLRINPGCRQPTRQTFSMLVPPG